MNTSTHRARWTAPQLLTTSVLLLISFGLFTSCGRQSSSNPAAPHANQSGDDCVARIGDVTITREAFEQECKRRTDRVSKQAVLEEMIRSAALLARAKSAGYDRDPQVVARINQFIIARFQEDQLEKKRAASLPVSEADVEKFYQSNTTRFATPEAARAAVIFVKCSPRATEEKKAELKRKAELLLVEARGTSAPEFTRMVERHSEDQATRYLGGETGWLHADGASARWPAAVIDAAFALVNPGEIAPLVTTADGFYVVCLSERKPASVRPLDQVRDGIEYQLVQEKKHRQQGEFFEEMKSGLKIEINSPLLESIQSRARAGEQPPPALPKS